MDERGRHRKKARGGNRELRVTPTATSSRSCSEGSATHLCVPLLTFAVDNDEKVGSGPADSIIDQIGIKELLEADSRPTFIIDLLSAEKEVEGRMNVVWCNKVCIPKKNKWPNSVYTAVSVILLYEVSLTKHSTKSLKFFDQLRKIVYTDTFYPPLISPTSTPDPFIAAEIEFKEWATYFKDFDSSQDGYLPRHTFRGMFWTSTTLRGRWRVISASQVPNQRKQSHGTPRSSRSNSRSNSSTRSRTLSSEGEDSNVSEETELERQLADSMSKFKVLTEMSPVGMYYLSPAGDILYCNDMWYEITGHPRGLEGEMSFMNVLSEIDHPMMGREWELLTKGKGKRVFELRLRNPWLDERTGQYKQKWILASCDQEFDEYGNLKTIMGCITDISAQKHAEEDAIARANLVEKLALRTQEAAQHERNFQQMAELAPCGMVTFSPEGAITWANPQFFEMTGHSRMSSEHPPMSFLHCIAHQDRDLFNLEWQKLTVSKEEVTLELRLKKPWIRESNDGAVPDARWVLFLALPQLDDNGNITKVLACTTDISGVKLAEHVQLLSRLQAEEAKRQQESFIDMTSHEMRNPLSAIMLCADGIASSVTEFQSAVDLSGLDSFLENNLDAAQTIVLCAQHQKRIIDDVLTLSKLNATMVHVTPVQVHIEQTVRRTIKMFESELQAHSITMTFVLEQSYLDCNIDMVYCDPVRLTQVFINLLSNAIKFTRSEKRREIAVNLGASLSKPAIDAVPELKWLPSKSSSSVKDLTLSSDWGTGEKVYLCFSVKDTGRGLSDDEKTRLFHRFSQASPRTHVQYGGSGLGLFISKELTELQGGEIGVASVEGAGSTFAFYIKARKADTDLNNTSISTENTRFLKTDTISDPFSTPKQPKIIADYHILLVEDNLINQKVLSKQLRTIGCVVHVANHGGEALDFLSKTKLWHDSSQNGQRMELSLILMDLEMPIMDGLAATRKIRDLQREGKIDGHVPIIAVTANTRAEQMDIAKEAGMDDIVAKPFQIPELMQKMQLLMAGQ